MYIHGLLVTFLITSGSSHLSGLNSSASSPHRSAAMHEGRVVKNLCVGRHIVFGRVVRIRGGIRVWVGVRDAKIDGNRREKAQGFVYHSAHYADVRSIMSNALLRE